MKWCPSCPFRARAAAPHAGQLHINELRNVLERRAALPGDLNIERQHDRQVALRHRNHAAVRAVDDRNRRCPK